MLSGDLPATAALRPDVSLTVEGVAAPGVADWDVTRDLAMRLPGIDDVGEAAAEGRVTIAPRLAGVTGGASPWRPGDDRSPSPMSAASLVASVLPGHSWPVWTGLLDAPQGSMWDAGVQAKIIDPIDSLSVPLRWDPLHSRHSALGPGGPFRYIGLTNAYVVDRAFRDAGWHATYPVSSSGLLDVPMSGSLMSRRGNLEATDTSLPSWTSRAAMPQAACAFGTVRATYRLDQTRVGAHEYFVEVDPGTTAPGTVRWDIIDGEGAGKGYRLSYDQPTRIFRVQRATRDTPGATTIGETVAQVTLTPADHRVSVRHHRFQDSTGTVPEISIRTVSRPASAQVNSTTLAGSYLLEQGSFWRAYLTTTDSPAVGAFGIDRPTVPWATWAYRPNISFGFTFGSVVPLRATPRLTGGVTALDVIRDQARAEYGAWGFTEDGRAFYYTRQWMTGRPLARTLYAADLVDFSWTHDTTAVRSSVTITRKHPATQARQQPTITVWQGRGDALDAGEVGTIVMAPESNEDWVKVDETMARAGFEDFTEWNRGRGTFSAAARVMADGTDTWAYGAPGDYLTGTFHKISDSTYGWDYTVSASLPDGEAVELRTPEGTSLRRKGVGAPILRAYGATRWIDQELTPASAGSSRAPRLVHDVGWHVQDAAALADLQAWLVSQVSTARPRLSGIKIKPDPRLQVGDRVRVVDDRTGGTGADVTGLVVRKHMAGRPGQLEMTLDVVEV